MLPLERIRCAVVHVAILACAVACASAANKPAEHGGSSAPAQPSSTAQAGAPDLSSEQAFTEWAAQRFNAISPEHAVVVAGPLTLRGGKDGALEVYLDRIWGYCKTGADDCAEVANDFVTKASSALTQAGNRPPPRAEQLRPALRSEDTIRSYSQIAEVVAERFAGDLFILYMLDTPDAASPLATADLKALGMTREEVRERALANLRAEMGPVAPRIKPLAKSTLGTVEPPHFYNSSLLLFADEWPAIAARFGKLLVSVPAVDTLLYVDAGEPMAAAALAATSADTLRTAEMPLSPTILIWTEKGFQPYTGEP